MATDRIALRKFGLLTGALIALLFGLLLPWLFGRAFPAWPWIVASALWLPALVAPRSLLPVHAAWMRMGHVLGWINTRIILGLIFFTVFLLIALALKLAGSDPMSRKYDRTAASYRVSAKARGRDHMEHPF